MALWLALIEAFFTTVFAVGVLTWFYNRYLAGLRESYAKKTMSLATLPLAVLGGAAHFLAIRYELPHTVIPAVLGAFVVIYKIRVYIQRILFNRGTRLEWADMAGNGMNYGKYSAPVALFLRLIAPLNQVSKLQVVRRDVCIEGLHPDMEDYRIVHLTDFHVNPTLSMEYFRRAVELGLKEEPDLLLIGGDFISRRWHRKNAQKALARLAEHPQAFAVRGNHDFWSNPAWFAKMLKNWRIPLLSNDFTILEKGEGRLILIGIESPYVTLTERAERELSTRLEQHGALPRLAMIHTPEAYAITERLGSQFTVSGHTHGGQIRLPFFGTTIASSNLPECLTWGAGRLQRMQTYTSNGIGAFFPVRFLCPPQITVFTLKKSA